MKSTQLMLKHATHALLSCMQPLRAAAQAGPAHALQSCLTLPPHCLRRTAMARHAVMTTSSARLISIWGASPWPSAAFTSTSGSRWAVDTREANLRGGGDGGRYWLRGAHCWGEAREAWNFRMLFASELQPVQSRRIKAAEKPAGNRQRGVAASAAVVLHPKGQ